MTISDNIPAWREQDAHLVTPEGVKRNSYGAGDRSGLIKGDYRTQRRQFDGDDPFMSSPNVMWKRR